MHEKWLRIVMVLSRSLFVWEKWQEGMQGMELWRKSDWFWHRKFGLRKRRKDGIDC